MEFAASRQGRFLGLFEKLFRPGILIALLRFTGPGFRCSGLHQRGRDGALARSSLQKYVGSLRNAMCEQFECGVECSCKKTADTRRKLLNQGSGIRGQGSGIRGQGIEPTNNDAGGRLTGKSQSGKSHSGRAGSGPEFSETPL